MKRTRRRRLTASFVTLVMLFNMVGSVYAAPVSQEITEEIVIEEAAENLNKADEVLEEEVKDEPQEEVKEEPQEELQEEPKEEVQEELVEELVEESVILNAELDGVGISVYAGPGVLSADTRLAVDTISERDTQNYAQKIIEDTGVNLGEFLAFDITLLDESGNKVQPEGQVEVSFTGVDFLRDTDQEEIMVYNLETQENNVSRFSMSSASDPGDNLQVFELRDVSSQFTDDRVSFTTDHFSIYGVGTKARATYNFYVDPALDPVDTQIVLDGEKLEEPETPAEQDGRKFIGWFIEGEEVSIDFNETITVDSVPSPSKTYKVEARFDDVIYVYFVYDGNIIATKELEPGETTNSSGVPVVVTEAGKALIHWSETENGLEFDFANTGITENTTLYGVVADRWKVNFDAQGGKAVLPQYIVNEGSIDDSLAETNKSGYTFKHWSLSQNGSAYDFNSQVEGDLTLYAVWHAKSSPYTVAYWQENANDDGYSLKEVVIKNGLTGTNATYDNRNYTGFTLNTSKTNAENVTIAGDESSVKHVYYKRNTHTLTFYERYYDPGGFLGWGSGWKTRQWKEFTGIKQGADTATWWSQAVAAHPEYNWYTQDMGNTAYSLAPDMPNGNLKVYGREAGNTLYTIFYLEDGTMPVDTVHEPYEFSGSSGLVLTIEDYVAFPGFTVKSTLSDGSKNSQKNNSTGRYEWKLYYTRNKYDITFQKNDLTGNETIADIPYESDISDKALAEYVVDETRRASDNYVFKGWYDNEETVGDSYGFTGKTMPAGDLLLYAKWKAPVHTVKVHRTPGEDSVIDPKTVDHGATIPDFGLEKDIPSGLTEDDFLGWYWYVNGVFVPYDFTLAVNDDFDLYPVWNVNNYTVTYDLNEGTGDLVVDGKSYNMGTLAAVLSLPDNIVPPAGKVFNGWKADGNGKTYYPNDRITITGNMLLIALWGDIVPDTSLTYKANSGVGEDKVVTLKNNDVHTVQENTFTKDNHRFVGWNTAADGSEDVFRPGDEIIVGNSNPIPNELYAQWVKQIDLTVRADSASEKYDGTPLTAGYTYTGELADGDELVVVTNGTITNVGTVINSVDSVKVFNGGTDVTANYKLEIADGQLEVTPKYAQIIVANKTKEFGQPDPQFEGVVMFLVDDSDLGTVTYIRTGTSQAVGKYVGDLSATFTDNPNYEVGISKGDFTIKKATGATLNVVGKTVEYDGAEHTVTVSTLVAGDTVKYSTDGGITWLEEKPVFKDVGIYKVKVKVTNPSYEDREGLGTVTITQKAVTIEVDNASKVFGVVDPIFTGTVSGLVAETDLGEVSYSRSGTDEAVATYPEVLGANFTDNPNYEVSVSNGDFEITRATGADLDVEGKETVYDGQEHTVAVSALIDGDTVKYSTDGGATWLEEKPVFTDVGSYTVDVKVTNPNYEDRIGSGTVKITEKAVTIKVDNASKVFGQDDPAFTGTVTGLVNDNDLGKVAYVRVGSDENVGEYLNVLNVEFTANTNYTVTKTKGDFTITKATTEEDLVVTGEETVYDGNTHTVAVSALIAGDTVKYSTDGGATWSATKPTFTNVGEYTVDVKVTNPNYEDRQGSGTVTITQKAVTIKVDNASKVFGQDDPAFTGTVTGLVNDNDLGKVAYVRVGSDENVDEYLNVLNVEFTANTNYTVTKTKGDFTITKATTEEDLVVTGEETVYDGNTHTVAVSALIAGDTVKYSTDGGSTWLEEKPVFTDVGSYTVDVKVTNPNYEDRIGSGTVTITAKAVTIKVDNASKVFGAVDPEFTGEVEGLVKVTDLVVTYSRSGTDQAVGNYEDVLIANFTGNPNYAVSVTNGDFEITRATGETLGVVGKSVEYDGQEHTVAVSALIAGDTVKYSTDGGATWSATKPTFTNVGEYTVDVKVTNPNYEDRQGSGTVTITQKAVTIKVDNASKVFGAVDPEFTGEVEGLVKVTDLVVTYSRSGSDQAVGNYEDVLIANFTGNPNYAVSVTNGDFEITRATGEDLSVVGKNVEYDGQEHTVTISTVKEDDIVEYSTDGGATWSEEKPTFTEAGSYEVKVKVTNPNYEDRQGSGTVTITQKVITLTALSRTFSYNGQVRTVEGFETSVDLIEGHVLSGIQASGSATNRGTYPVDFTGDPVIMDSSGADFTENYDIRLVVGSLVIEGGGVTEPDDDDFVEVDDEEIPLGQPEDTEEDLIEIDDNEIPLGQPDRLNMVDHIQYIMGYPNNTVRPEGLITREEVAAVFFRLLTPGYRDGITTRSHNFLDVNTGRWSEESIASLANAKIIVGYENGKFGPSKNITRAELAAIASRFDNLSPTTSNKFTDIDGHWALESINSAAAKGWVSGYGDGTFRPNQYITRSEFVTLVNNVLNRKVRKENILPGARQFPDLISSKWYYEAMQEAINSHYYIREEDGIHEIWTELYNND